MKWSGFRKLLLWKITMFNNIYIQTNSQNFESVGVLFNILNSNFNTIVTVLSLWYKYLVR